MWTAVNMTSILKVLTSVVMCLQASHLLIYVVGQQKRRRLNWRQLQERFFKQMTKLRLIAAKCWRMRARWCKYQHLYQLHVSNLNTRHLFLSQSLCLKTEPKFGLQGEQVRAKTREIVEVHKREATRQEKILVASRELELAEAELSNLPDYEPPTQEIVSFLCYFGALYLHLERYQLDLEAEDIHLFIYIHMGVGVKFLFDYRVLKVRTALCLSVIPNHWLYWLH